MARGRRWLLAKATTEILAPTVVLVAGYNAVTAGTAATVGHALVCGAVAALLGGLLPFLFILIGVRRGRLSDHHIRVRGQRHVPLLVALAGVVVGLILLVLLNAPRPLLVLFTLVIVVLVPCMVVTVWWQISVHTAIAALVGTFLMVLWGPWLAVTGAAVAAVGWSRVVLRAHTVAQVCAGTVVGAAIGMLALLMLG